MKDILDVIHKTIYQFFDICGDKEVPMSDKDKLLLEVNKAICNNIKALKQEPCEKCVYSTKNGYCQYDDVIETIPPLEPKTGHWIGDKAYPICPKCNCNIIEEYISCSDYAEMYKPMKYCPNCGARMVEPQESEE